MGKAPDQANDVLASLQTSKYDLPADRLKTLKNSFCKALKTIPNPAAKKPSEWNKNCKLPKQGVGHCAKIVKEALTISGMVSPALTSLWSMAQSGWIYARDGGKHLEKDSFKNILDEGYTSENPPKGAVLVYADGASHRCGAIPCGHVEVYMGNNLYCSDYCTDRPIDKADEDTKRPKPHRLLGIFVKVPGETVVSND